MHIPYPFLSVLDILVCVSMPFDYIQEYLLVHYSYRAIPFPAPYCCYMDTKIPCTLSYHCQDCLSVCCFYRQCLSNCYHQKLPCIPSLLLLILPMLVCILS